MTDIVKPILQKHAEALLKTLKEQDIALANPYGPIADADGKYFQVDAIPINGAIARAAAGAGMLNGTSPDDLEPWQIAELAARVILAVRGSLDVPKAFTSASQTTPTDAGNAPTS